MAYFDDLRIGQAGICPEYKGHICARRPQRYSIELLASGRMYFEREPEARMIIDYPALRWQSPDHVYHYGPVDDREGWEHYYILLKGERAARLYHEGFVPLVTHGCVMPIRRVDVFRRLFIAIHDHAMHTGLDPSLAAFHTEELLVQAMADLAVPRAFDRYLAAFEELCVGLHADLGRPIGWQKVAARFGLSYSHFRRLFTEYAGVPPQQYLLRARLTAAAGRLRETDDPPKRIAHDLGLGNPAQFSKSFRAAYGLPPGAYRREEPRTEPPQTPP
jgi:AraC-like DNA-binding protein